MNISQFIVEEVKIILKEGDDREVLAALDKLIQEIPAAIPELEKVVASNILPYISSTVGGSLKEAEGDEAPLGKAAAAAKGAAGTAGYVLSHLPMGKKMGVMIATALDATTEDHVRNAVLFALGNLIAGQLGLNLPDLGDLIQEIPETMWEMLPFTDDNQEWDWGVLNAIDDSLLLTWAWLKVKNAVDVEEKLHEFGKFIGRSNLGKQPEAAGAGAFDRDDMSLDAKSARAAAAKEKGKKFRGLQEQRIKKSEIYNIIKEELEVILTNEEVEEIFDLDLAALLDEMVTISTDDLYLAEMFDTGSDTKESCAAKGLSWDEAAGKCGPWKSGLEEGCPPDEGGGEAIDISAPGMEVHVDDISQLSPEEAFAAGMAAAKEAIDQVMGGGEPPPMEE